jgi:hypothetical protein
MGPFFSFKRFGLLHRRWLGLLAGVGIDAELYRSVHLAAFLVVNVL